MLIEMIHLIVGGCAPFLTCSYIFTVFVQFQKAVYTTCVSIINTYQYLSDIGRQQHQSYTCSRKAYIGNCLVMATNMKCYCTLFDLLQPT